MNICLLFSGPAEWYANLKKVFDTYGKTWLQQRDEIEISTKTKLDNMIKQHGFFIGLGYISKTSTSLKEFPKEKLGKVCYVLKIDEIISSRERLPPPDDAAAKFDWYDIKQGHCKDEYDYKYKTWFKVIEWKEISPVHYSVFGLKRHELRKPPIIVKIPPLLKDVISDLFDDKSDLNGKFMSAKKPRFWLIAPGEGAEYWDVCVNNRIICVGWREAAENLRENLFEIDNYGTFLNKLEEFRYSRQDASQLWKFLKEVSEGDILLAKKGMGKIIGIGIVYSSPKINFQLEYPIYRKVKWYRTDLDLPSPKQFAATITEITKEDIENVPELKRIITEVLGDKPPETDLDTKIKEKMDKLLNSKKQIILYGPPGTGKTWLARNYVKTKVNDDEKCKFVTFHPSYSYEEFVEGLKPVPSKNGVKFIVEDGIFKRMAIKAMCEALISADGEISEIAEEVFASINTIESGSLEEYDRYVKSKRILWDHVQSLSRNELRNIFSNTPEFYLIIDEINRGDISKIFGELITLLEADKRLGCDNQIIITLPYSKEPFGIPPNLYIIGTMNTADRSIALIDIALRRRFGFIELMPDYGVLEGELLSSNISNDVKVLRELAIKVLKSINERIKKLYDRDHQIGHSYLLKLKEFEDLENAVKTLRFIWYYEILPLLQEYFYDSPEKLGKVLNDSFVKIEDNNFEFEDIKEGNEFIESLKKVAEESK
jgi:DNA polymerase III delta prime subunit